MGTTRSRFRAAVTTLAALGGATALAIPATVHADGGEGGDDEDIIRADRDQLIVSDPQSSGTFNPFMAYYAIDGDINRFNYDSLIRWSDEDYEPTPGIATDWEEADDGLSWTYTIRDDVVFSDGEPLTAEDVEFTYQTMMDVPAVAANFDDLVSVLEDVEATDETTVEFTLNQPSTQMEALDQAIVPEHVWEDVDDFSEEEGTELPRVGSGPFQVTEFEPEQFIRLEANEHYWGEDPEFDELIYRQYQTPDAAVQALHSGAIDIVGAGDLTPTQFESLEGEDTIATNPGKGRRSASITFNVGAEAQDGTPIGDGHPALADSAVRQAMHHAVDRQEIIDNVYDGYAEPGVSYVAPIYEEWFWEPEGDDVVEFDLDRANEILDEAGYERGPDGVRMMPDGSEPLSFRLLHHADSVPYQEAANFFQEWWEEIGLEIEIESNDTTRLNDRLHAGQYDVIFSGWSMSPNPTSVLALYTCDGRPETEDDDASNTDTWYCNPEYDQLHEEQQAETDTEQRAELLHEMQRILYTDAPHITFAYADQLEAYRSDRWEGFATQPHDDGIITRQMGRWGMSAATPVEGEGGGEDGSPLGWILGAGAVVLVGGVVAGVTIRRRRTADERE